MNRIRVRCECSAVLLVKSSRAGSLARCPQCQRPFTVPSAPSEPTIVFEEAIVPSTPDADHPAGDVPTSEERDSDSSSSNTALARKLATLTPRQREIYDYIRDRIESEGFPPSVREIGEHFSIGSPNGVMAHLKALEKKGLIERDSHAARSIRLIDSRSTKRDVGQELDGSLLTTRQLEIFQFLCDFSDKNGFGPTVREIGEHFQISSPNGVASHLKALEKKGFIERRGNSARGLRILGRIRQQSAPARGSDAFDGATRRSPSTGEPQLSETARPPAAINQSQAATKRTNDGTPGIGTVHDQIADSPDRTPVDEKGLRLKLQRRIYDYIRHSVDAEGVLPTASDIAEKFNSVSYPLLLRHLKSLAEKNLFELAPGRSGSYRPTRLTRDRKDVSHSSQSVLDDGAFVNWVAHFVDLLHENPTIRDVQVNFNISDTQQLTTKLVELEKSGLITISRDSPRGPSIALNPNYRDRVPQQSNASANSLRTETDSQQKKAHNALSADPASNEIGQRGVRAAQKEVIPAKDLRAENHASRHQTAETAPAAAPAANSRVPGEGTHTTDGTAAMRLAQTLHHVQQDRSWMRDTEAFAETSQGKRRVKGFYEWAEVTHNTSRRHVADLLKAYQSLVVDSGLSVDDFGDLRWATIQEVVPIATPSNARLLISTAAAMSEAELGRFRSLMAEGLTIEDASQRSREQSVTPNRSLNLSDSEPSTQGSSNSISNDRNNWLSRLPDGRVRDFFDHLDSHGIVAESEAVRLLGGARNVRRFSSRLEELADLTPFRVRVDLVAGVKRYVKEEYEQ